VNKPRFGYGILRIFNLDHQKSKPYEESAWNCFTRISRFIVQFVPEIFHESGRN
jgi:hypothetical protein